MSIIASELMTSAEIRIALDLWRIEQNAKFAADVGFDHWMAQRRDGAHRKFMARDAALRAIDRHMTST